ncbi:orotidine-5'-phosphate decarboxylase [Thermoflavifilum thermophilum]|uniref:Orotidine-5'-phosphate decarboxylase n=1 Tax=Thermoflavifilum thermophilum TaxID=1393122 RepID=A0A1I7NLS3_9BACT|nr:orotidine-5'-phosphate decarboxylase [Thermoflavifilum thermophilum]SFV35612.1 orotidine-5'-phosphate decarboxylase [Thermoflavifilum thermophilum]
MNRQQLVEQIRKKQTCLCIGLDPDMERLPSVLSQGEEHPVLAFHRAIIQATAPYCVAYKLNTAFYEVLGSTGWQLLEQTLELIPDTHFKIADAKRGDVEHTARQYARAFFESLGFDAVTVSPLLGKDSVQPFLDYTDKWTILLGLTSNAGSQDFLQLPCGDGYLYERIMRQASGWASPNQLMFVVGATWPSQLQQLRQQFPDHFFLVPGIGAQGGDLQAILESGQAQSDAGLLINVSRAILYASTGNDFATAAAEKAAQYAREMAGFLQGRK